MNPAPVLRLQDVWQGGDLWHQYLANQGYIVVSTRTVGYGSSRTGNGESVSMEVGTFTSQDQAQEFWTWPVSTHSLILPVSVLRAGAGRQPDIELYVPLSGCILYGYCHCLRIRPAVVWHDLSGTLHGIHRRQIRKGYRKGSPITYGGWRVTCCLFW